MKSDSWDFTIDLRKLRLLSELERRGTLTAVALVLHLTPSAVSQQLASLSRELGVPLLERRGRSVTLTGQARVMLRHAEAMQEQLERTRAALAEWSDGTTGQLRIGSLTTGITSIVAPAVRVLREERPGLEIRVVEVDPEEAVARLDRGELDVVVAVDFPGLPGRDSRRFHRVDLIIDVMDAALPPGHPLAGEASVSLADLAAEPWVGGSTTDNCSQITLSACAASGFSPDTRHQASGWEAVAALVSAGAGVALIPRLAHPLQQQDFTILPLSGEPAARVLFALVRAGTQLDPGTAAVLATLRKIAAERTDGAGGLLVDAVPALSA
jgi:DNA-binding transcriptional LysR family regulator